MRKGKKVKGIEEEREREGSREKKGGRGGSTRRAERARSERLR